MTEQHEHLYRLASAAEWVATEETGVAPTREIDKRDGYIHLSTRAQVIETANLHFAGARDLLALEIPHAGVADQLIFELAPKRGEEFPHLYGVLRREHVSRVIALTFDGNGFQFGEEQ